VCSGYGFAKIALLVVVAICIAALYLNRHVFRDYLIVKARRATESIIPKIEITDVRYAVSDDNVVVTGKITNKDITVVSVSGVRVAVLDGSSKVLSWESQIESGTLPPGRQIEFSATHALPPGVSDMRVEVSVF
jgi:ABC-type anion transport system duplicated permease subunit